MAPNIGRQGRGHFFQGRHPRFIRGVFLKTPPQAGHRHSIPSPLETEDREDESFSQTGVWFILVLIFNYNKY